MSKQMILDVLAKWQSTMQECEQRMDDLASLVGHIADSPLGDAVYHLMGAYTESVADMIEWPDEYLEAWWTEHAFGEKPMNIGFSGEPLKTISTIEQLAAFVAEDLRRSA
jgi:predicted Zn-dependent peptidase